MSILTIAVGLGWLLNAMRIVPSIDWIWTLGLGLLGIVILLTSAPLNRLTYIVGFFLLLASVLSVMRQTDRLSVNIEIPLLVIGFGVLNLTAELLKLPLPAWVLPEKPA